jgi:cell division protein FtsB
VKKTLSILSRRKWWILLAVILVPIISALMFNKRGVIVRIGLEQERSRLKEDIQEAQHIQDSLQQYMKDLRTDTFLIESIAREKYGMLKPNEKAYIFRKDSSEN